jgi:RHS repeat-associated protein
VKASSNGVVVLQNWYDANSRRIAKQEVVNGQTQKWIYLYDGWDIVGVMNENGQMRETFTRGVGLAGDIGTLVAVTHHAGSTTNGTFYTHCNHRGDVVLTRSGTATVGSYDYSAFGTLQSAIGPDLCRFKFSSKERDASTGFSYYGFRFYAPQWQRWPNADPIGEEGGLNLYSYVGNNSVNTVDPLGLAIGGPGGFLGGFTGPFNGFWKRSGGGIGGLLGAAAGYLGGKMMEKCPSECKRSDCEKCCARGAAVGGAGALLAGAAGCIGTGGLGCGLSIAGAALGAASLYDDYKSCMVSCSKKQ